MKKCFLIIPSVCLVVALFCCSCAFQNTTPSLITPLPFTDSGNTVGSSPNLNATDSAQINNSNQPSNAPLQTQYPNLQGIEYSSVTLHYPSGSTESNAKYKLTYTIPVFNSETYTIASELNASVSMYVDSLLLSVSQERVPLADSAQDNVLPYTDVSCNVTFARGYTNIVFTDESSFGTDATTSIYTIVSDESGVARPLAYVCSMYNPSELVAQQLLQVIEAAGEDSIYFHDIQLSNIAAALDLVNGYEVTADGFRIHISAGALTSASNGSQAFDIPTSVLSPSFVGNLISTSAFYDISPIINYITTAQTMQGIMSFEGIPDSYTAAYSIAKYFLSRDYQITSGSIHISKADYDDAFLALFNSTDIPKIPPYADFIKIDGDSYMISVPNVNLFYGIDYQDAVFEGGNLILIGQLMSGVPGEPVTSVSTRIEVTLIPDESAWFGYKIASIITL